MIGVVLAIVILVIIGVFLVTRTNVNEPKISPLVLPEGGTQQNEIEEVKLELIPEKKLENSQIIEEPQIAVELLNTEEPDKIEESQIEEELQYAEKPGKVNKPQTEEKPLHVEEEETLPEGDLQLVSVDTSNKTIHKVKPNDSLIMIAKEYFGDETKWDKIFEANKGNMSGPHSLYVGQELLIPDVTVEKAESQAFMAPVKKKQEHDITINIITHKVQSGDSLYRIAEKYYDDPTMWEKIYEANKETIEDKDLLRKGQNLIIPQ